MWGRLHSLLCLQSLLTPRDSRPLRKPWIGSGRASSGEAELEGLWNTIRVQHSELTRTRGHVQVTGPSVSARRLGRRWLLCIYRKSRMLIMNMKFAVVEYRAIFRFIMQLLCFSIECKQGWCALMRYLYLEMFVFEEQKTRKRIEGGHD